MKFPLTQERMMRKTLAISRFTSLPVWTFVDVKFSRNGMAYAYGLKAMQGFNLCHEDAVKLKPYWEQTQDSNIRIATKDYADASHELVFQGFLKDDLHTLLAAHLAIGAGGKSLSVVGNRMTLVYLQLLLGTLNVFQLQAYEDLPECRMYPIGAMQERYVLPNLPHCALGTAEAMAYSHAHGNM